LNPALLKRPTEAQMLESLDRALKAQGAVKLTLHEWMWQRDQPVSTQNDATGYEVRGTPPGYERIRAMRRTEDPRRWAVHRTRNGVYGPAVSTRGRRTR
jgi:hypothetical protein